jgi:hypothetical protein
MANFAESFLVSIPVVILIVEVARASPLARWIHTLVLKGKKTLYVLNNKRISDHWKERVLLAYAITIFQTSVCIFILLLLLLLVFTLGINLGASLVSADSKGIVVLEHSLYMIASFLVALLYLPARNYLSHVRLF